MPLWTVYHTTGAFSDEDKAALAERVSDIYARVMPRFYASIVFLEMKPTDFFMGGKPANNFVRIVIEHIAREFPDEAASRRFIDLSNKVLAPFVADRGLDWEFHIDETRFEHWSINGFYPPRPGTPDELRWREDNKPSPRTHD